MEIYNQLKEYSEEIRRKINELILFNKWILVPKDETVLENICVIGLYALYSHDEVFYIGVSSNIGKRVLQHLKHYDEIITRIKIKRFNNREIAEFKEKELIHRIRPKNNKFIVSRNAIKYNKSLLSNKYYQKLRKMKLKK